MLPALIHDPHFPRFLSAGLKRSGESNKVTKGGRTEGKREQGDVQVLRL